MPSILVPRPSLWKPPLGSMLDGGHPLAQGLVALWPLNEGGGTQANDLVGVNPSTGFFGSPNMAGEFGLTLNGTSYLSVPEHETLDVTSRLTFTARIRTITDAKTIFSHYNPAGGNLGYGMAIGFGGVANKLCVWSSGQATWQGNAGPSLIDGLPHTLGASYDGVTLFLYVDGVQVFSVAWTQPGISSNVLYLGTDPNGAAIFNGFLDYLSIYKTFQAPDMMRWLHEEPFAMFRGPEVSRRYLYFRTALVASRRRQNVTG